MTLCFTGLDFRILTLNRNCVVLHPMFIILEKQPGPKPHNISKLWEKYDEYLFVLAVNFKLLGMNYGNKIVHFCHFSPF